MKKWTDKKGILHAGKIVSSTEDFDIVECETCGFKHIVPIPTEEELKINYSHEYYDKEKPLYIESYLKDKDWWHLTYSRRFEIIEKYISDKQRKVLDIGSGPGLFLNIAKLRGWEVYGVEPSQQAAEYSIETLGLEIHNGFFDRDFISTSKQYNAINMSLVLEHLPEPKQVLLQSFELLEQNGVICITVPNDFNPFQKLLSDYSGYPQWWVSPPHHINYFNFESLTQLVETCGFKVIHTEASFPIDMFLLMGDNYVQDGDVGKQCHEKRKQFETILSNNKTLDTEFRSNLAKLNIGREIIMFAQKQQTMQKAI